MSGSLQSQAHLEFDVNEDGQTILRHRRAGGLCHVSKPYLDGKVLGVQLVNPTAGFFQGDDMGMTVQVNAGAQVALSSPSATRFYSMEQGGAKVRQDISVGEGSWLEYHTNWVIPQSGSTVEQVTQIEITRSGELMFVDCLAPGRVKHGEQYCYQRYVTSFELRYAGELRTRERMVLEPDHGGWPLAIPGWEVCFYGAVWFVTESLEDHLDALKTLEEKLSGKELLCGVTRQGQGVAVIRLVAARGLLLKKTLDEVRKAAQSIFPILKTEHRILKTI